RGKRTCSPAIARLKCHARCTKYLRCTRRVGYEPRRMQRRRMPYAARIVEIERTRVRADCAVDRAKAKDPGVLHEEGALLRKERLRCSEVEHCRIDLHLPEVGIERHSPAGARRMEQNV